MTRPHLVHTLGLAIGLALSAVLINHGMRSAPLPSNFHPHHSDVNQSR